MKAAVRCRSLTLSGSGRDTLYAQEKHGKREDQTSQLRRIRDVSPLVFRSLDLRAEYDRHMEGVKMNAGCKRPVLHFVIKMPDELLGPEPPGPFAKIEDRDARKRLMAQQAVRFINETHGGNAVFSARVDRDEAGELVVDIFAAPKYAKTTKKGQAIWASPTKFGKELAEKHADEIQRRHPKAKGALTGPRHVGIALQAEFAVFFERENGVKLTRQPKDDPRPDRLETEAFKAVKAQEVEVEARKVEIEARESDMSRKEGRLEIDRLRFDLERSTILDRLKDLGGRMVRYLKRPDLPDLARKDGVELMGNLRRELQPDETPKPAPGRDPFAAPAPRRIKPGGSSGSGISGPGM